MKKIALLTSVLTLTACAGGSGGGTPGLSAEESNARVTGMNSFVVMGGSNPTVNPNARMSILQSDGGTRYDLENVSFNSIPTSGVIATLIFNTDADGKINSIQFPEAETIMESHEGSEVPVGPMKRQGDTNVFKWNNLPIYYESYAQDVGLKYADFGILKFDATSIGEREFDVPFSGGYNIKNINNDSMKDLAAEEISGKVVFTGLVKGQVSHSDLVTDTDIALEGGLTDNDATLTFKSDGSQILAADFENWARIRAVKAADGKNQFIVDHVYDGVDPMYVLATSSPGLEDGVMGIETMAMKTGYYGDDNLPNEAVGLVQYQYMTDYNEELHDYRHHINVDLGFGGIK